jgi:hypothetical protein
MRAQETLGDVQVYVRPEAYETTGDMGDVQVSVRLEAYETKGDTGRCSGTCET